MHSGIRIVEGGLVPDPGVLPGSAAAEVSDCNAPAAKLKLEDDELRDPGGARILKPATPATLGRWLSSRAPGVEDFVVIHQDQEFVRRDRADFDSPSAFVPGIFHVINELELCVHANFSEDVEIFPNQEANFPNYQDAICTWMSDLASQENGQVKALDFRQPRPESLEWKLWQDAPKAVIVAQADRDDRRVDHVCRLARAQWNRGGIFFIKFLEKFARTSAWEKLRSQCLQSSAAQRLWRKSRTLTNAKDHVRYQRSASGESKPAEAWWKSPVEQAPEFHQDELPDEGEIEEQATGRQGAQRQGEGGHSEVASKFGAPRLRHLWPGLCGSAGRPITFGNG